MLGTNDAKEWYGASPERICAGMEYLVCRAQNTPCWTKKGPNILVVAPPPIAAGLRTRRALPSSARRRGDKTLALAPLYKKAAHRLGCAFFDAGPVSEINRVDCVHMTRRGCRSLAAALVKSFPDCASE